MTTGAAVGTVRGIVRDVLADFLAEVLAEAALWFAGAFVTLGGSLAAGVTRVVLWALDLADDIVRRISRLLDLLSAAGGTAGQLADAMRDTVAQTRAARPLLQRQAADLGRTLDDAGLLDVGSGVADANQERWSWDEAAAGR